MVSTKQRATYVNLFEIVKDMTKYMRSLVEVRNFLNSSIFSLLLILSSSQYCHAETIYLSVAASMTDAIREIVSTFSTVKTEGRILVNYGSSGSLAKQINQGAPAHLYISANPKWMDYLIENGAISLDNKRTLAYNSLVFISQRKQELKELSQIKNLKRIAIGSPGSVPAGQYAKEAMETVGIYSYFEENNILVMAKDVRQALLYADRGEVDGAFVYKTDAILAQNAAVAFTVPETLYSRVAYPVALTKRGAESELTKEFFNFLIGDKGAQILDKFGFESLRNQQ